MVEFQLPKLAVRVRFPLPAPEDTLYTKPKVANTAVDFSEKMSEEPTEWILAHVAQQVEHFLGKEEVRRFEPARELHFNYIGIIRHTRTSFLRTIRKYY